MIYSHVGEVVNNNIFLKLDDFYSGSDVFIKVEGFNSGGSIKAKTALALIEDAENHRNLRQSKRFIESSSGNLGVALSIIAAAKGYKFTCVTDKNVNQQNLHLMRALGTEVIVISQRDSEGAYLGNRLRFIRMALERDKELIWLNQYKNPANPAVHARLTASAILKEFGFVDYLFVGAGTTGTLMGVVEYFRDHSPLTTLIAVDSVGSITFGNPSCPRFLSGIGASVMPYFFDASRIDHLIEIPEAETVAICRAVALRYGFLGGASTGTVLAAIRRMLPSLSQGALVVGISPDLGTPYLDTLYDDEWCDKTFGLAWRTLPIESEGQDVIYA